MWIENSVISSKIITRRRMLIAGVALVTSLILIWFLSLWRTWKSGPANLSLLRQKSDSITNLAETIIPRTDTPGAADAQVASFIVDMVTSCVSDREQYTFIKGIEKAEQDCELRFGKAISACTREQLTKLLFDIEQGDLPFFRYPLYVKIRHKIFGRTFFQMLRSFTVIGYCTSEVGATQGLQYDAIPGSFLPCITIDKTFKAWATV